MCSKYAPRSLTMQPLFQPWTLIRKTLLVVVARPDDLCWCCKVRIQQINAAFSKNVEPPRACKHIRHAMAGSDGGCQVDVMDSGRGYLSASYELETATQYILSVLAMLHQ